MPALSRRQTPAPSTSIQAAPAETELAPANSTVLAELDTVGVDGGLAPVAEDSSLTLDAVRGGTILEAGSEGPAVGTVQEWLAKAGFPVPVTGVMDAATLDAVKRFQRGRVQVSGRVGPTTLAALEAASRNTDLNKKILAAALAYRGSSTRAGPDGGNLACAWAVNNVLGPILGRKLGSNTVYVPSVEEELQRVAIRVKPSDAQPGDIVIAPNSGHIGIYLGGGTVLSNSSSRAAFVWESGMNFDGYYGGGSSTLYRIQH